MVLSTPKPVHSSLPTTISIGGRCVSIMQRPADYSVEWSFVLRHARTIERYALKMSGDSRVGFDDIRQESVIWIIRNLGSYDPARSAPTSWIYFMVRRARQELIHGANRRASREVQVDASELRDSDTWASAHRTERAVLVRQVLGRLPPTERRILTDYVSSPTDDRTDGASPPPRIRERVQRLAQFI